MLSGGGVMRKFGIVALCAVLCGCASYQLNRNFADLASTSVDLITSQVLSNLSAFSQNPYAQPSQVGVPSGSVTTTNSITPTVGGPLGSAGTLTLANSAAAPLFNATTNTHMVPNGTIGVTAADQWSQNYSISPYQDPLQLLRLQALYRFGAGQTNKWQFLCEYPLVQKAAASGTSGQTVVNVSFAKGGSVETSNAMPKSKVEYQLRDENGKVECRPYEIFNWDAGTPDPALLKLPACVICDENASADEEPKTPIKFEGNAISGNDTITGVRDSSTYDIPAIEKGSKITGSCIPAGTKFVGWEKTTTIRLSNPALSNGECTFFVPIAKSKPVHKLFLNPSLSNDWIVFGPLPPNELESLEWLGTYKGRDVYVKTDEISKKRFSDFVVRVLEATLMAGTGAAATAATPGKIQAPAAPTLQLN
jgi:hypothetical protein